MLPLTAPGILQIDLFPLHFIVVACFIGLNDLWPISYFLMDNVVLLPPL